MFYSVLRLACYYDLLSSFFKLVICSVLLYSGVLPSFFSILLVKYFNGVPTIQHIELLVSVHVGLQMIVLKTDLTFPKFQRTKHRCLLRSFRCIISQPQLQKRETTMRKTRKRYRQWEDNILTFFLTWLFYNDNQIWFQKQTVELHFFRVSRQASSLIK